MSAPDARVAVVIPARFGSVRFPGKPLVAIRGAGGRPLSLIERTIATARGLDLGPVHVATDDARIADVAGAAGAIVIMTPATCANGSERVAAALDDVPAAVEIVVNVQGDAPLIPPAAVHALVDHMMATPDCAVATVAVRVTPEDRERLEEDQALGRSSGVTVVTGIDGRALYFSRQPLPAKANPMSPPPETLLHLGLYAYRRPALHAYAALDSCPLEEVEGLEQLRFLSAGIPIDVVQIDPPAWDVVELNHPADLPRIEAVLAARGID